MRFDIRYSNQGLPGGSGMVPLHYSTDTGGTQAAAGLRHLGHSLMQYGQTMHLLQGEAELAQALASDNDEVQKMLVRFEGNQDEHTYQDDFEQTYSAIASRELKNGWARREHNLSAIRMRPQIQKLTDEAKEKRVLTKFADAVANAEAQAEQTGDLTAYDTLLQSAVNKGLITNDKREVALRETRHLAQRRQVEVLAAANPDAVLAWQDVADMQKAYPDTLPAEFRYFKGIAEAQKRAIDEMDDERWTAVLDDTLAKAMTMDVASFRAELAGRQDINERERAELMKTYIGAAKLWGDEGVNPWTQTTDYVSLAKALDDAQTGKITTREQINDTWLKGNKPNWSLLDWQKVIKEWEDRNKPSSKTTTYSRTHPVAQVAYDQLKAYYKDYAGDDGVFKDQDKAKEYMSKFMWMEEGFLNPNVWDNDLERNKHIDNVFESLKQEKAKGILSRAWNWFSETTGPKEMARPMILLEDDRGMVTLDSLKDAELLPKGQKFWYKGEAYEK